MKKLFNYFVSIARLYRLVWHSLTTPTPDYVTEWYLQTETKGFVDKLDLHQLENLCGLPVIFAICAKEEITPSKLFGIAERKELTAREVRAAIDWYLDHK